MSRAQHTPGPWELDDENAVSAGSVYIASVKPVSDKILRTVNLEEWNANASLIAAAPDLLDALESIVSACDNPNGSESGETLGGAMSRLLPSARAAIAKATSEA